MKKLASDRVARLITKRSEFRSVINSLKVENPRNVDFKMRMLEDQINIINIKIKELKRKEHV